MEEVIYNSVDLLCDSMRDRLAILSRVAKSQFGSAYGIGFHESDFDITFSMCLNLVSLIALENVVLRPTHIFSINR